MGRIYDERSRLRPESNRTARTSAGKLAAGTARSVEPLRPPWGAGPLGPPRRSGRALLIGIIAGVVVLVAAGVVTAMALSSDKSSTTSAASSTSATTTSLSAAMTQVVPSQVLPAEQQMKQTTLLNLSKHGETSTQRNTPTQRPTRPTARWSIAQPRSR